MRTHTKLLKQNSKTKNAKNVSVPRNFRKVAPSNAVTRKPESAVPIRPVDEAAAHQARIREHLTRLDVINQVWWETTLGVYRDAAPAEKKKAAMRRNAKQACAAISSWHCDAIDLVEAGKKLHANLADLHKQLQQALVNFGGPRMK